MNMIDRRTWIGAAVSAVSSLWAGPVKVVAPSTLPVSQLPFRRALTYVELLGDHPFDPTPVVLLPIGELGAVWTCEKDTRVDVPGLRVFRIEEDGTRRTLYTCTAGDDRVKTMMLEGETFTAIVTSVVTELNKVQK